MSKRAEAAERKYYGNLYSTQMRPERDAFIKGYEQAEKDLALTKEDVRTIFNLVRELQVKYSATEGCFQEVADIFNEQREKK